MENHARVCEFAYSISPPSALAQDAVDYRSNIGYKNVSHVRHSAAACALRTDLRQQTSSPSSQLRNMDTARLHVLNNRSTMERPFKPFAEAVVIMVCSTRMPHSWLSTITGLSLHGWI
jgi:hypothetical protein